MGNKKHRLGIFILQGQGYIAYHMIKIAHLLKIYAFKAIKLKYNLKKTHIFKI